MQHHPRGEASDQNARLLQAINSYTLVPNNDEDDEDDEDTKLWIEQSRMKKKVEKRL